MLVKQSNSIQPYIILLTALILSIIAAYYSVYGIGKLFAGEFTAAIIMAGCLEFSKIILASSLHKYYSVWNIYLKIYLTLALLILMIITSMGIYGFLSSAYTVSSNKLEIQNREIGLSDTKISIFSEQKDDLVKEKELLINSISELRNGLSNPNQIQYKDRSGQIITTTSSASRISLENQLENATKNRDNISNKIQILSDSISKYEINKIEILNSSDIMSELGPLQYISNLLNISMDRVVNFFILLLIFVFDPLAIALIIAANHLLNPKLKNEDNIMYPIETESVSETVSDSESTDFEEIIPLEVPELTNIDNFTEEFTETKQSPDIFEDIEQYISSKSKNITDEELYNLKIVDETPRGELKVEKIPTTSHLTPEQIRNMSHQTLKNFIDQQTL